MTLAPTDGTLQVTASQQHPLAFCYVFKRQENLRLNPQPAVGRMGSVTKLIGKEWEDQSYLEHVVRYSTLDWNVTSYLLIYSMVQSPSWEANWLQLVKKFPAFHGTRRFITALTSVRHLSLSWASPIQYIYPHPTSWRSILILSTNLRLGLPSGLFPSGFPTKNLNIPPLFTHTSHMPSPSHSSRFYHSHNIGWAVQIINVTSYLL